jgi:glycosyltransferase involved in cell wall biosynthesis
MKPKAMLYTDCYIYGGSEKLLISLIRSKTIQEYFSMVYAFRYHDLYLKGVKNYYTQKEYSSFIGLRLLSNDTLFYKINMTKINKYLKIFIKFPFWLFEKIKFYSLYNFIILYFFVKWQNPDILHINNGGYPAAKTCITIVDAAYIAGCKKIIMQVNNQAMKVKRKSESKRDAILNTKIKYYITASQVAKITLSKNRGFSLEKIVVIPNAIIDETITVTREKIRNDLSLPSNSYILCEVAFLEPRKGQIYLIDAMKILSRQYPIIFENSYLLLVGDGIDRDVLNESIIKNELIEHIKMLGYKPDAINYINACDVFILPSVENEDMPLVILQAMKLKKNIIASDFAGIQEEIEDGISGLLIKPNKITIASELVEKIVAILTSTYCRQYGANAYKRYCQLFTAEHYEERMKELYFKLNEN